MTCSTPSALKVVGLKINVKQVALDSQTTSLGGDSEHPQTINISRLSQDRIHRCCCCNSSPKNYKVTVISFMKMCSWNSCPENYIAHIRLPCHVQGAEICTCEVPYPLDLTLHPVAHHVGNCPIGPRIISLAWWDTNGRKMSGILGQRKTGQQIN